jgi:GT2 family glycosyltransferase
MLVPQDYAAELWRRFGEGYEAINLKRFIFYLDEEQTRRYFESGALDPRASSEAVVQNLEAGGSVAVGRDAFFALGGFDESFVGWGGEDNEFWERALTRKAWPFGCLPIVHLWHAAQPRKQDPANPNLLRYTERSAVPPLRRIEELRAREFGRP